RKIAERNQLTIETEPRLIEMNFGIYDGEPIETTAFQENRSEISLPFPEGESVLDVAGRIYPLIEEALASEETYLFVCHNAVMRVIDNYFNGKKIQDFLDFHCENTQLVQYGE
ncbi:histidine phosphatase family protein, partial [Enterococcus faecalis]